MLNTSYILHQIKVDYNTFGKKDKIIADYILENPRSVVYLSISEFAEILQVAEATIFRFCKKLGLNGFQSLKISLATEVVDDPLNTKEIFTDKDDVITLVDKVFKTNITTLEESLKHVNKMNIKQAINAILQSKKIVFYGNGGSGLVALDAQHKFLRTGLTTDAFVDSHMQLMSISQLTSDDLAIVISHSGSNLDMLNILKIAKNNNVKTIGITSFTKSPISQEVDIPLNVISHETEYQFEAFASRLAHLSMIDCLYINVSLKNIKTSEEALKKMRNAISLTRL